MTQKTVEDVRNEIKDKINGLLRKRNSLVIEADTLNKELSILLEQQLALDESKIRIYCLPHPLGCNGVGYIEREDGKKQPCPICGGPDKPYIWATKYVDKK